MTLEPIEQGLDNRYSAFGRVNGRPFVCDAETEEEATAGRTELRHYALFGRLNAVSERAKTVLQQSREMMGGGV